MSDTFQCVQCGAKYTRERRRVGRAVVCACGHKFLVPPAEESPPAARPSRPVRQPQPRMDLAAESDSSGEVLPLAELIEDEPQPPERWAEPVVTAEPVETAEPLLFAEVVKAVPIEPGYAADDLFDPSEAYGEPVEATSRAAVPRRPATGRDTPSRRSKRVREDGTNGGNRSIAYIVLYAFLAFSLLLLVVGLVQYRRLGRSMPAATDESPTTEQSSQRPDMD